MSTKDFFKISEEWKKNSIVSKDQYEQIYEDSVNNNINFWKEQGERIDWFKPFTQVKDIKYSSTDVKIKWYYDGVLNASFNCIDRHAKKIQKK